MGEHSNETELTLGTGKLLALFFGMAVICGVFFSLGYGFGKSSGVRQEVQANGNTVIAAPPSIASNGAKPAAGHAQPAASDQPAACAPEDTACITAANATAPPEAQTAASSQKAEVPVKTPELAAQSPIGGFMVQVAAVTKQEDAEALVSALRKKQYPVLLMNNDQLYHVQVGPFADLKDAEAMKARLVGDGYNAILKK
jgi:DedD protein